MLSRILAHPLTRHLDLDDPNTTAQRIEIIRSKPFLRQIYHEWYSRLAESIPDAASGGDVVELGSGAGFLREYIPDLITSDVFHVPGVDRVIDAGALPFEAGELRGIVMTNVLHHLPDVERFLAEAQRCVRIGGVMSMIEPWHTAWSRMVYQKLHHEPFEPAAESWTLDGAGPLSDANGALPWIVFERDRQRLESSFQGWRVERVKRLMPLRYLLSGGVSMRSLMPGWSHGLWRGFEGCLPGSWCAMFGHIVVRRVDGETE